jgi:hypothetical protein
MGGYSMETEPRTPEEINTWLEHEVWKEYNSIYKSFWTIDLLKALIKSRKV